MTSLPSGLVQPGSWVFDLLNHLSLEDLSVKLMQNPMERPALLIRGRGFLLGDRATGGVFLEDLALTVTLPDRASDLASMDLSLLKRAYARVDRMCLRISRDWMNKVLRTLAPMVQSGLREAKLDFSETDSRRLTFTAQIKGMPVAVDLLLGMQGNLLFLKIHEVRLLKILPLLSFPGLKRMILNEMKSGLPSPMVRMSDKEIFIDILSQAPLPVDLRWRCFQTEKGGLIVEAGGEIA